MLQLLLALVSLVEEEKEKLALIPQMKGKFLGFPLKASSMEDNGLMSSLLLTS